MSWTEITMGKALHVKHGFAFKGAHFVSDGEFIVLTPGNFNEAGGFRARPGKDRYYAGDIPAGYILERGALIVAMTEQAPGLLGSSALIPQGNRYLHNQRLGLVEITDPKTLDLGFTYYLFNTPGVRGQLSGSASGTKVRHTAPERIYKVRVTIPDVSSQGKIASTLSRYDRLIANNTRRIELLERSAQLLFEEWFIRLRYPGHQRDEIVDGVPEAWTVATLGELTEITFGQSPKSKFYNRDGVGSPFHQGVSDFGFRFVTDRVYSTAGRKIANPGDILFSVRAPVGRINLTRSKIIVGRGLAAIRSKRDAQNFLFYALKQKFFKEDMMGTGAIFAAITSKNLKSVPLTIPTTSLINQFQVLTEPLDRQIEVLHNANRKAIEARDLLFPRLMDGRIPV